VRNQGRANRRFGPNRRLTLGASLFVAITMVASCLVVWDLRNERIADEMKDTKKLAIVLVEQTSRSFQAIDLVLQEIQAMASAKDLANPDDFRDRLGSEEVHGFLIERLRSLPQAISVALVDDVGRITNFSRPWPIPVIDVSDREYFSYLRDHQTAEMFIGPPIRSKLSGLSTLTIARRVSGHGGEFLGVVAAYVNTDYFEDFYASLTTRSGESVTLFRQDGTLLARHPHNEQALGEKLSPASPWYENLAKGGGTYRTPGYVTSVPRIISVEPSRDYPFAVSAGVSEDAALAPWRRQSIIIAVGALGAVIGFAIIFFALASQFRRLTNSEDRFRDFAQTSSDWLWETDQQHRFTYVSEGVGTSGFTTHPGNVVGRTRLELAVDAGGDPAKWDQHYAVLERREPLRDFTYTWRYSDGVEGIASITGNPFHDAKGRFLGYRGTGRDITAAVLAERSLREAKDAAEAASHAKSQFLANTSHELRTPLNAILGFSEALNLGLRGQLKPAQAEYVGLVHDSGQHLLTIINDILDLARVDAGKLELHEESEVDPRRLVDACSALMRQSAISGGIRLSTDFDRDLPLLRVDATRLRQIVLNLLSNAIKFTKPGGNVVLAIWRDASGGVCIAVRDTGLGMTPDEVAIALEPFGQVESGDTRRFEGTGLGVPLAKRLTELHGGTFTIDSEKGKGTCVTVTIPAARVIDGHTAAHSHNPTTSAA
jgi:PAS domain S-box-containing protein